MQHQTCVKLYTRDSNYTLQLQAHTYTLEVKLYSEILNHVSNLSH